MPGIETRHSHTKDPHVKPTTSEPDTIRTIRRAFPALGHDTIFLENAGGSQVPAVVVDAVGRHMVERYVQLGAGYGRSRAATAVVDDAHAFANTLMNGSDRGRVILGSSTTSLLYTIADAYARALPPGREIILAETGHEANVGPWLRLAEHGHEVRWWRVDPGSFSCPLPALEALLSPRTAIVAFPHVSNLLGDIVDVAAITELAHEAGARVVVDGVAFAPHRAIDVAAWDVDWYAYSTYKVYGPHMAALYGRADAIDELTGPNHFFIPRDEIPYKFELGGACHEGCAGILALGAYLDVLADLASEKPGGAGGARARVEAAFELMTRCELPVQARLLEYLATKPDVSVVGPSAADASRVSTISFRHARRSSREITGHVDRSGIGIRHGHMYAYRLCQALGIDVSDGVVRVSAVHYNTVDEIDRLIEVLDDVL